MIPRHLPRITGTRISASAWTENWLPTSRIGPATTGILIQRISRVATSIRCFGAVSGPTIQEIGTTTARSPTSTLSRGYCQASHGRPGGPSSTGLNRNYDRHSIDRVNLGPAGGPQLDR